MIKRYQSKHKPFSVRRFERKSKRKLILTILITGALIYFIFFWFLPTFIGSLSVLNKLKPQAPQRVNVAESSVLAPPVFNIPYEATKSSTISIKGYTTPSTEVEIYLDDILKETVKVSDDGSFTSGNIDLFLGSNNIYGKTVDGKGDKSLPSKTIRIIYDNEAPKLEISSPSDNQEIKGGDKKVTVSGTTDPDANLEINNNRLVLGSDGNFSRSLDINDGENNITITAKDTAGNVTEISRKVIYQPS